MVLINLAIRFMTIFKIRRIMEYGRVASSFKNIGYCEKNSELKEKGKRTRKILQITEKFQLRFRVTAP